MIDWAAVTAFRIPEGEVLRVLRDDAVLWEKPAANVYTFVDGIALGSATFRTDFIPQSSHYVHLDCTPVTNSSYSNFVCAGTSSKMRFWADGTGIYANIGWYNQKIANLVSGTRIMLTMDAQKIFLDGVQKVNMTAVSTFTADGNLILGGVPMVLHGFQYGTDPANLKVDYVPAIRTGDGAAGLYDKITDQFVEIGTALY